MIFNSQECSQENSFFLLLVKYFCFCILEALKVIKLSRLIMNAPIYSPNCAFVIKEKQTNMIAIYKSFIFFSNLKDNIRQYRTKY